MKRYKLARVTEFTWHIILAYSAWKMFSFNLDCPGAKGLTILSLLPGCAALIAVAHMGF